MKHFFITAQICITILSTATAQNIGIGINAPVAKLHVVSPTNRSAVFDGAQGQFVQLNEAGVYRGYFGSYIGSSTGNDADVDFGTGITNATGKLHLAIKASSKLTIDLAGNVGIGTTTPSAKLHVNGNLLIAGSNTLEFGGGLIKELNAGKIGYGTFVPNSLNIIGAGTNILNRQIWFFNEGGAIFEGNIKLNNGSKFTRAETGTANLVPIAYGVINGGTSTILSGTGNFTFSKSLVGLYIITVNGETIRYNTHTWSLTVLSNSTATFIQGSSADDTPGIVVSAISYNAIDRVDRIFSFVLYRN